MVGKCEFTTTARSGMLTDLCDLRKPPESSRCCVNYGGSEEPITSLISLLRLVKTTQARAPAGLTEVQTGGGTTTLP